MISWEKYIKSDISEFRKRFEELSEEVKKIVQKNERAFLTTLNKPCQVAVISFVERSTTCFIVVHSEKRPDMETLVLKDIDLSVDALKKIGLLESLSTTEIQTLVETIEEEAPDTTHEDFLKHRMLAPFKKLLMFLASVDIRSLGPTIFSWMVRVDFAFTIAEVRSERQREVIRETIGDINKHVEAIPIEELRRNMLESTKRLASQINQLGENVNEQISAIRRTIGASEKYLDWKAFTTDFEYLKKTHIARKEFEAHTKRLDERIDEVKESFNTRIEDLKAVKFWSKRTLLEIALAILAVIATLYGAGVIKFPPLFQ